MKIRVRSVSAATCLVFAPLFGCASVPEQRATLSRTTAPAIEEVLKSVRRATGYARPKSVAAGFAVTETEPQPAAKPRRLLFGTRAGEIRDDVIGFDGDFAWQIDKRSGLPTPVPQRLREKLSIPLWVRGHWWLSPRSPFKITIDEAHSDARLIALNLGMTDGLVPATVFIDRASRLPAQLVVGYERGPFTVDYADYRPVLGMKLAHSTSITYRGKTTSFITQSVDRLTASHAPAFRAPPLPSDHHFDNSVPARLETRRGMPFGDGSPGHYYVSATVDDAKTGWFHFDSGADGMIIETTLADELKMPVIGTQRTMGADGTVREGTYRRGKSFRIGRLLIKEPVWLALDLSANNAPPGARRSGTIGFPLFARSVVEFSNEGGIISLHDPAEYRLASSGKWQRLSFIDLTPAVPARFGGNHSALFQVDTGHSGTVAFYKGALEKYGLMQGQTLKERTSLGAGGEFKVATGSLSSFDLGGRRFTDLPVSFRRTGFSREGGAGLVGRELLKSFMTTFDYPNRRISFVEKRHGSMSE